MPKEVGKEATRSDAPSADDALFGDATDGPAAAVAEEPDADRQTAQDPQGSDNAEADTPQEGLKVVVSIKGGRATIGVQQSSSDPHIEAFDGLDEAEVTTEVPAVIERARARWEETPKYPAYERPTSQARSRNRRQQGAAQDSNAKGAAEREQQQTLRLF